jgi:predicted RNase H-like HicB family nuclease
MNENMKFKVVLEKDEEGFYAVWVPALPGCYSQGRTEEEALENIKEAIELHLTALAEEVPAKEKGRVREVTVRL